MAKKSGTRGTFIQNSRAKSSAEKATYHDIAGAGKAHTRRPFFSLTDDDEVALVTVFEKNLAKALEPKL